MTICEKINLVVPTLDGEGVLIIYCRLNQIGGWVGGGFPPFIFVVRERDAERGAAYDTYRPAYQYGWEARGRYPDRQFEDVEPELERGWNQGGNKTKLPWSKAKPASRDAWDRIK